MQKVTKKRIVEVHGLNSRPFCGANLAAVVNQTSFAVQLEEFFPCPNADFIVTSWKPNVDLICPVAFKFEAVKRRWVNAMSKDSSNSYNESTICNECTANGHGLHIIMCPMSYFLWTETDYGHKAAYLQQCDSNQVIIPYTFCNNWSVFK